MYARDWNWASAKILEVVERLIREGEANEKE
jgi:hypothetical protein